MSFAHAAQSPAALMRACCSAWPALRSAASSSARACRSAAFAWPRTSATCPARGGLRQQKGPKHALHVSDAQSSERQALPSCYTKVLKLARMMNGWCCRDAAACMDRAVPAETFEHERKQAPLQMTRPDTCQARHNRAAVSAAPSKAARLRTEAPPWAACTAPKYGHPAQRQALTIDPGACRRIGGLPGGAHGVHGGRVAAALRGRAPAELLHQRRQLAPQRRGLALQGCGRVSKA